MQAAGELVVVSEGGTKEIRNQEETRCLSGLSLSEMFLGEHVRAVTPSFLSLRQVVHDRLVIDLSERDSLCRLPLHAGAIAKVIPKLIN